MPVFYFENKSECKGVFIRCKGLECRKLFEIAVNELKKMGFDKMIIACLKGNPTRNFYEHMGGKYIKDGTFTRLNLKEDIFYYDI